MHKNYSVLATSDTQVFYYSDHATQYNEKMVQLAWNWLEWVLLIQAKSLAEVNRIFRSRQFGRNEESFID